MNAPYVEAARTMLRSEAFAWAKGRAMALEEVVALTLEECSKGGSPYEQR